MPREPFLAPVRAVDVGYYNTKFTLGLTADETDIRHDLFPSMAVALDSPDVKGMPGFDRADAFCVIVNDKPYWVGKHVASNSSGVDPRPVLSDYSATDQYLALVRAAFHYMLPPDHLAMVIKYLVVGLPLTTWEAHRQAVKLRLTGVHHVDAADSARTVTVENVYVIPQPQGCMMNFGRANAGTMEGLTLVVDMGGGTLDWFLATKKSPYPQRSGAYAKGMLACAEAVAKAAGNPQWVDQYHIMERIDVAIRNGHDSFRAAGVEWPLAKYRPVIVGVLEECIDKMMAKVKETDDIDRVILTGGGAKVLDEVLRRKCRPLSNRIHVEKDPVFSNVRGFQIFGETIAKRAVHAAS